MKDKMLEESLNNLYRTFLIWVIRCYPILFCLAILVHQCEVIHSVGTGDIIEYYDGDTLEYIQYATPFRTSTLPYSLTPNCLMQYCSMCCQRYFYFVYTIEYLSLKCLYTQYWILYLIMWCLRMHI